MAEPSPTELDPLRDAPPGLPGPMLRPPVVAESGDPFAMHRIVDLVARLPRGRPLAVATVTDRLNAMHLDWLFERRVVGDALVQLQANWMADYRNVNGILLDELDGVDTVTIEDSSRVDPWLVRQAARLESACRQALLEFSRQDRLAGG